MAAGERTIRIRFTGTAAKLVAAAKAGAAAVDEFRDKFERHGKVVAAATSLYAAGAAGMASLAQKGALVATVFSSLVSVGAMLANSAGAAPLFVAGMLGAAGAIAAVKLGADGAKRAFEGLRSTTDTLKAQVSGAFEKALLPGVNSLKTVLPQLSGGLQQIATAMGQAFSRVTELVKTSGAAQQLNGVFGGMATIIRNIGAFLAPVIVALIRIGSVAMPILAQMTAGFGAAGERFRAFIDAAANDGRLAQWIQNALTLFHTLGDMAGQAFSILHDVISGLLASDLGGLSGGLGTILATVQAFTSSAAGQQAIRAVGDALAAVSGAVGQVLNAGLRAIAPIIPPLAAAFAQLATMAGTVLAAALRILAPILLAVANFLQQNMSWLGPVVIAVGALAAGLGVLNAAFAAWKVIQEAATIAQWAWNAALAANPVVLVIGLLAGLVAAFVTLWNKSAEFRDFFIGIWNAIKDALAAVGRFFADVWDGIWLQVDRLVGMIRDAWNSAGDFIKSVFRGVGNFLETIWDGIGRGLKGAINWVIDRINSLVHGVNDVTGIVGIPKIPDIPHLARGGTATAGQSYLVGERGPELFTPGRTGRVTNANTTAAALGAATAPEVHVYIGDRELTDLVRVVVRESNRATRRAVLAGGTA